jgi:cell division protein FtsB
MITAVMKSQFDDVYKTTEQMIEELEYENRMLRARNDRLENEVKFLEEYIASNLRNNKKQVRVSGVPYPVDLSDGGNND